MHRTRNAACPYGHRGFESPPFRQPCQAAGPQPANRFIDEVLAVVAEAKKIPKGQWPKKEAPQYPDIPAGVVELLQALVRHALAGAPLTDLGPALALMGAYDVIFCVVGFWLLPHVGLAASALIVKSGQSDASFVSLVPLV